MAHVQPCLSTVSAEFRSYRDAMRRYVVRSCVTVKVRKDFIAAGMETPDKLDDCTQQYNAVRLCPCSAACRMTSSSRPGL